ncbi:hypothetical protein GCM10009654_20710 [Streptomyces hebeiensis]|uniref:Uncharacterized protein n=1 Tax=Streptomyces hebeiensis TaxID=229486 RepID=A0ABN1UR00_9ACTN
MGTRVEQDGYTAELTDDLEIVYRNPRGRKLKQLPDRIAGAPGLGSMFEVREHLAEADETYAMDRLRLDPAALKGPDDPLLQSLDDYLDSLFPSQWLPSPSGLPALADLRLLLSEDFGALGEHLAADATRVTGWEQHPARAVPRLVEECAGGSWARGGRGGALPDAAGAAGPDGPQRQDVDRLEAGPLPCGGGRAGRVTAGGARHPAASGPLTVPAGGLAGAQAAAPAHRGGQARPVAPGPRTPVDGPHGGGPLRPVADALRPSLARPTAPCGRMTSRPPRDRAEYVYGYRYPMPMGRLVI